MKKPLHERLPEDAMNITEEIKRDYISLKAIDADVMPCEKGQKVWRVTQEVKPGDFVKRPAPKALDADGVEIKRGDEVWRIHSKLAAESGSLIVEGICDKGVYTDLRVDGKVIFFDPLQLTHDQPVFDADDVRICKGDTVWCLLFKTMLGGKRLEVVQFKSAEEVLDTLPHIIVKDDDGAFYTLFPHNLTHREPDSFEKLRDRMHSKWSRAWAEGEPITEEGLHIFVDDLTALIERGA